MAENRFDRLFHLALSAGEQRDYRKAAELLLTLVSETDDYPQAYLYLGRSFHALGMYFKAIHFLHYFTELCPTESAGYFFLGRSYLAGNLFKDAVIYLQRAEALDPGNPQILGHLGIGLLKCRRIAFACEVLGRAVEADPENKQLYSGYLNALTANAVRTFRRGDVRPAAEMFEFLIDRGVSNTLTHLYLAACFREVGQYQDALIHFDIIIEREPNDPVLRLQRTDMLIRLQKDHTEKSADDSRNLLRQLANESFTQGKWRRALDYAKEIIATYGTDFEMHLLMGDAFRQMRSETNAINHFRRAIDLDRRRKEPRYGIVLSAWRLGEFRLVYDECKILLGIDAKDEIASYYRALSMGRLEMPPREVVSAIQDELDANGPDAFLNTTLGVQFTKLEEYGEAARHFRTAIDLSGSHREAYEGLFALFDHRGVVDSKAETYLDYLSLYPDDHHRRREYVKLLLDERRFQAAAEEVRMLLPLDGETEGLRRLLAYCLRESSRYREAAVVYRRLLKEHPDSDFYLRSLAFCIERSGNSEGAAELLKRGFAYKKPRTGTRLILGSLLVRTGDYEGALAVFRKVLEEMPSEWRAYQQMAEIFRARGITEMADRYDERSLKYRNADNR